MPATSRASTVEAPPDDAAVTAAGAGAGEAAGDGPAAVTKAGRCGCIGGLWTSREMAEIEDRELVVRTNLRELIVYLVFLTVVSILSVSTTSSNMYYFTKALSELFLDAPFSDSDGNFRESTQVMDIWRFLEGPLVDGLYWETWYDKEKTKLDDYDGGINILYENRLLGVPRMRQLQVRNDSCRVADDMRAIIKECYAEYSWLTEVYYNDSIGTGNGTEWRYCPEDELEGHPFWGEVGTYSGGGAYVDLSHKRNATVDLLARLRRDLWVGRGTRAIFVDFTVYNANINLFCIIKLVFELPATGGVIPSSSFRTVKLLRYVTSYDYFIMACEWTFILFTVYYFVEELLEFCGQRSAYFKHFWNHVDMFMILISIMCIGFSVHCSIAVNDKIELLLKDDLQYPNFEQLGFFQTQFTNSAALCVFFAWVKLFKYISFNKTMNQLSSTLSRCARDITGFAVMFFIVFFAFAQLGYLLFGSQVRDFSSFGQATFTLLRTILGDFDFHEIEAANRILGPIFFLSYVFFVFFVLMNMFLAIINDTYCEVKSDPSAHKNAFEVADYFKRGYNNVKGKLGKRDRLIDLETALKLMEQEEDGSYSLDMVWHTMKRCNFSDQEIDLFFDQYHLGGDGARMPKPATDAEDDDDDDKKPEIDVVRLHRIVFGHLSREAAAARLRGSPVAAATASARHRDTEAGGDTEVEDDEYGDYDEDYDDYDDYDDQFGVSTEEFTEVTKRLDRVEQSLGTVTTRMESLLQSIGKTDGRTRPPPPPPTK